MVRGCNPVILLVKLPVPVPLEVKLLLRVGYDVVDQQTPRAVTAPSPSLVIFPPDIAEVEPIEVTTAVERVAVITGSVVKESSPPYEVPTLLVA